MADNISVKDAAGSTVVVRAEDNTSVFLPLHGIADTTGANVASVDSASALKVATQSTITTVTLSLDTAAYADGDVLADSQIVTACFSKNDGFGVLNSITVLDEDDQGQGLDLVFLSSNVSLGSENAAPSITDANARNILGWVRISASDFIDLGGSRLATISGISLHVKPVSGSDDMYVAAISRGTGTYTASGIQLLLGISCEA